MTKRKCPFDLNLSQQLKVHVSQKEYNETNEFAMNKVHSKTLDMLFKGAKNVYKSGKTGSAQNNLVCNENTKDFCVMCNEVNAVSCKCEHCDRCLCMQCLTQCINCGALFCKSCSVKLYVHDNTDGYCLSCYSVGNIEL